MTNQQKRFIEEYAISFNGTRAYMAVFGCEYDTAKSKAYRLLKKPEAQEYLKELQAEAFARYGEVRDVLARELFEDVVYKDEKGRHSSTWQKSVELLQKQMGLQTTKVEAKVEDSIEINITDED